MKALSLYQPWATLIALGEKHIETRSRMIAHRGPLAIHAAQRWVHSQSVLLTQHPFQVRLAYHGITQGNATHANLPRGAIVATCDLVGILSTEDIVRSYARGISVFSRVQMAEHELSFGDYGRHRFAYLLGNIRRLAHPVMVRGRQGLFNLTVEDLQKVIEQADAGFDA